jgi:hypothetical protein
MSNIENVLNKIRKLSRLSESNNPHEAALAAEMMAKLMQEHQVTQAQLHVPEEMQEKVTNDNVLSRGTGRNIATWMTNVAFGVCESVGCKLYFSAGHYMLIGRKSDSEAASYMFHAIVNQVKELANKHWENEGQYCGIHGKAWKNSFYLGASNTIYQRLKAQKAAMMDDLRRAATGDSGKGTALMVINKKDYDIDRVYQGMKLRKKQVSYSNRSRSAYDTGTEAGHNVNLGSNKSLGKPNKLIGG